MNQTKIKISIRWILIGIFAIIIAFISSRLFVGYINELLRSNWQYQLFESESSYRVFANCIMISNIFLEIFLIYICYKMRKRKS
ncbi:MULTISPECIES: hypothetical protein [Romboutsia]|jgi:hypothetical protein|uniref:hypothetical protein n=1 Tax=Romboutsia TaxID=1501226 RepID=UPI0015DAEC15|nr:MULTISPECIES: hypothetical protein [Romboutsia]MCI9062746.1 hypothetical protein [Romboutsia sp.]